MFCGEEKAKPAPAVSWGTDQEQAPCKTPRGFTDGDRTATAGGDQGVPQRVRRQVARRGDPLPVLRPAAPQARSLLSAGGPGNGALSDPGLSPSLPAMPAYVQPLSVLFAAVQPVRPVGARGCGALAGSRQESGRRRRTPVSGSGDWRCHGEDCPALAETLEGWGKPTAERPLRTCPGFVPRD